MRNQTAEEYILDALGAWAKFGHYHTITEALAIYWEGLLDIKYRYPSAQISMLVETQDEFSVTNIVLKVFYAGRKYGIQVPFV